MPAPRFYKPRPELRDIVTNIMIFETMWDNAAAQPLLMPPVAEHSLYFYPRDPVCAGYLLSGKKVILPESVLVGPQPGAVHIWPAGNHLVIKVGFMPGALHRLLHIPMTALLRTEAFDATELLGSMLQSLNDQLAHCNDLQSRINAIELFLIRQLIHLKAMRPVDIALQQLLFAGGQLSIEQLASNACLSLRQLERSCKERTGFSPKYFARLVRFSRAWQMKQAQANRSWLDIAHTCGYFDQMHLIRDFKQIAGYTPGAAAQLVLPATA